MADWQDIAVDNLRSGIVLLETKRYRSATSRFYYAAFAAATFELGRRGAAAHFRDRRDTPSHAQVRDQQFLAVYLTHFSDDRRSNFRRTMIDLYRDRIAADYSDFRVDREAARNAYRRTLVVFRYLEMNYERN